MPASGQIPFEQGTMNSWLITDLKGGITYLHGLSERRIQAIFDDLDPGTPDRRQASHRDGGRTHLQLRSGVESQNRANFARHELAMWMGLKRKRPRLCSNRQSSFDCGCQRPTEAGSRKLARSGTDRFETWAVSHQQRMRIPGLETGFFIPIQITSPPMARCTRFEISVFRC